MSKTATGRIQWRSPVTIGVIFAVTALIAGVLLFVKIQITTTLSPGTSFDIQFTGNHGLLPYSSKVKVAGIPVGVVTSVEQEPDKTATVTVKIDDDAVDQLGSAPSASIRPTTLLGGNYYLDLKPGGDRVAFAGSIPAERTELPVELNDISHALQPDALAGLKKSIPRLNKTLGNGGSDALDRLVADAPDTLDPAADVLRSVRGTRPRKDLPDIVRGLESASLVLSEQQGQLDSTVTDLRGTVDVLDARSQDIADTVRDLPTALDSADAGIQRLDRSLGKL
ncbi:MAG: MCE family protein, partial [Actinophytocola sp.]|nr:MCE family protein [Actinophytocola sp.]